MTISTAAVAAPNYNAIKTKQQSIWKRSFPANRQMIWGSLLALSTVLVSPPTQANPLFPRLSVSDAINLDDTGNLMPGEIVPGASTLVRRRNAVEMTFHATGLQPGAVYTAWWVVFNRPEHCSDGVCDADDVFIDPTTPGTSVLWAAGLIAGHDGTGNFSARLRRHAIVGEVVINNGLRDFRKAEIHIVLRTHGEPIPGLVGQQISRFNGDDCAVNVCQDVQAAIHLPFDY